MREEIKEVPNQREVSTKRKWLGDLFTGNRMMTLHKALAMYKEVFHYFSSETSPSIETVRRAVLEQQGQRHGVIEYFKRVTDPVQQLDLDGMVQNPDEFHIPAYCPFSKPIERGLSNVNHFIRKFIVEFLHDDPMLVIRKAFEDYWSTRPLRCG